MREVGSFACVDLCVVHYRAVTTRRVIVTTDGDQSVSVYLKLVS